MKKFEYYVFLTICEISLKTFSHTKFVTYVNYCRIMNNSIENKALDNREMSDITSLVLHLKLIYNFDTETAVEYITKYFKSELYNDFKIHFEGLKKSFPLSFN